MKTKLKKAATQTGLFLLWICATISSGYQLFTWCREIEKKQREGEWKHEK